MVPDGLAKFPHSCGEGVEAGEELVAQLSSRRNPLSAIERPLPNSEQDAAGEPLLARAWQVVDAGQGEFNHLSNGPGEIPLITRFDPRDRTDSRQVKV